MNATILLIHRISVSIFVLSYIIRLIGMLGKIGAIQNLYYQKIMRILVDMIISTVFLITGVYMLINMPGSQITMLLLAKIGMVLLSIPLAIVGFKKNKISLAVISVILIIGSYGLAEVNHRRPPVSADKLISAQSAAELFTAANCSTCHGEKGGQPVAGAMNLQKSVLDEEALYQTILKGRNAMPSYKKGLTDQQIRELAVYVLSLRNEAAK